MRVGIRLAVVGMAAAGLFASYSAQGEEALTDRERALLQAVEKLEQRVADLEKQMGDLKSAAAATATAGPATAAPAAPSTAPATAAAAAGDKTLEGRVAELEKARAKNLEAFWKDTLRFQSADEKFKLQVGGRLFVDFGWFNQDEDSKVTVGDEQDGANFRSARLNLQGELYQDLLYRIEYEFSGNNGPTGFTDTYIGMKNLPYVGTLMIGHYKEPFSLDQLTIDSYVTFMERSLPATFAPARNLGVQLSNAWIGEPKAERLAAQVGVFKETDNWPSANDSDEDQGYSVTGRVTGLPIYQDDGRYLLHLGLAYSHRNPDGAVINRYQIQPNPESRLSVVRWLSTEGFAPFRLQDARADDVDLYGFETAANIGPVQLQGEYIQSRVETTFDDEDVFSGWYVQGAWLITGETHPYRNALGIFDRIRPANNFAWGKGLGAWELALRYSTIDLNDGGVRGGEEDNVTLGLNWYLNPNFRVMWNYTKAEIEHDLYEGDLDIFQTRFQVDF